MQILESTFPNIYFGLNFYRYGIPLSYSLETTLTRIRNGDVPPFQVFQTTGAPSGEVATPPPFVMVKYGPSVPTPKGKGHICLVEIRKVIVVR